MMIVVICILFLSCFLFCKYFIICCLILRCDIKYMGILLNDNFILFILIVMLIKSFRFVYNKKLLVNYSVYLLIFYYKY